MDRREHLRNYILMCKIYTALYGREWYCSATSSRWSKWNTPLGKERLLTMGKNQKTYCPGTTLMEVERKFNDFAESKLGGKIVKSADMRNTNNSKFEAKIISKVMAKNHWVDTHVISITKLTNYGHFVVTMTEGKNRSDFRFEMNTIDFGRGGTVHTLDNEHAQWMRIILLDLCKEFERNLNRPNNVWEEENSENSETKNPEGSDKKNSKDPVDAAIAAAEKAAK